jgi:hypothetical protein
VLEGAKVERNISLGRLCTSRLCESARVVRHCLSRVDESIRTKCLCPSTIGESARTPRRCASTSCESARTKTHFVCKVSLVALEKRLFRGFLPLCLVSDRGFRDPKRHFQSKKARFEWFHTQCSSTNAESARSVSLYLLFRRRFVEGERPNRAKERDFTEFLEADASFRAVSVSESSLSPMPIA